MPNEITAADLREAGHSGLRGTLACGSRRQLSSEAFGGATVMRTTLLFLLLAALPNASAAPLDIARPIALETVLVGICTGDRFAKFIDARGQRFQISIVYPPEAPPDKPQPKTPLRSAISVVRGDTEIKTTDGDSVQQELLQMLSEATQKFKKKRRLSDDEDFRLRNLKILVKDIKARQPLRKGSK